MSESNEQLRLLAAAQKKLHSLQLLRAFDANKPNSRPTEVQQEVLEDIVTIRHRYVLGGNQSGKTQTAARECAWVFAENHPHWNRPNNNTCGPCQSKNIKVADIETDTYECKDCGHVWVSWGDETLTMIVIARLGEHCLDIWEKKIRPFLAAGEYKEESAGGSLQRVVNPKNGNKIIFFSHHNAEAAREKLQYFVAHWVWLDEMPKSYKLLEELHRRCQSKSAPFLATFTPKLKERRIKKMIETKSSIRKKYVLKTLENPINKHPTRRKQILEEHSGLPKELLDTVLDGGWYGGELAVYSLREDTVESPPGYTPAWRHLEFVDPAGSGKVGFGMLAEHPATHCWYLVCAEYIKGDAATTLLDIIEKKTEGFNIVRRVSDPHEVWFIKEAAKRKRKYVGVYKKNDRKKELINNLQESWNAGKSKIAPWCEDAIAEVDICEWSETVEGKIVGASKFHILDGYQYGIDNLPKPLDTPLATSHDQQMLQQHRERKQRIKSQAKFGKNKPKGRLYKQSGRKVRLG